MKIFFRVVGLCFVFFPSIVFSEVFKIYDPMVKSRGYDILYTPSVSALGKDEILLLDRGDASKLGLPVTPGSNGVIVVTGPIGHGYKVDWSPILIPREGGGGDEPPEIILGDPSKPLTVETPLKLKSCRDTNYKKPCFE